MGDFNYVPWVKRVKIIDKNKRLAFFQPNWAQLEFYEDVARQLQRTRKVKSIILKARQLGMSTATAALYFTNSFLFDNMKTSIVAHEIPASRRLLSMSNLMWESWPFARLFTSKYVNQNALSWVETNSEFAVMTAKNAQAGRSQTIHQLHGSEVAFWDKAEDLTLGLFQAMPESDFTFTVLESTANGVGGYFYDTWEAALNGDNDFTPLFFPWTRHPEYSASYIGLPYTTLKSLSDQEKVLRKLGVDDDRLAWRRYMLRNKLGNDEQKFQQEYPTTPEEAFIATGTNVFPLWQLRRVYEPMQGKRGGLTWRGTGPEFVEEPDSGPLTIYRMPAKNIEYGQYIIGADPTHTTEGDWAVAQVISRRTLEQVAVLRYRPQSPGHFAQDLIQLGRFYNWAWIAPEKQGPGYMTIGYLQAKGYPRIWKHVKVDKSPGRTTMETYGWDTTEQSKELAMSWLKKIMVDGINEASGVGLRVHHAHTFKEMKNYVTLPNGGFGPADESSGGHDDTVMALAIAVACHFIGGPIDVYEGEGVMDLMREVAKLDPQMFDRTIWAEQED